MRLRILHLVFAVLAACSLGSATPEPPPGSRTDRTIADWRVRVDDRLLAPANAAVGPRALQLLEAQLADIASVVAPDRLAKLRAVPIVLDLAHGNLEPDAKYHPDPEWLAKRGYARDLAKCVHIPDAAYFIDPQDNHEQPWLVLHELAHAYHHQVLGYEEPRIHAALKKFEGSGRGNSVLHIDGQRRRHYALTNQKEFFAEMSEAYFGMNDYFPFNRAELQGAEPEVFALLRDIWGAAAWEP